MKEEFKEYYNSNEGKGHALQLLGFLYNEYRTAERYLYLGLAFLFALLAYLWKEIDITGYQNPTIILCSSFLIIWGLNLAISIIYNWYLGVGVSIIDYERKLTWLHVRPMFQFNLGLYNYRKGKRYFLFISPIVIPIFAGLISGIFYLTKFVIPVFILRSINSGILTHLLSIFFVLLICFSGLMLAYRITSNFKKALNNNWPPKNFEIGAEDFN